MSVLKQLPSNDFTETLDQLRRETLSLLQTHQAYPLLAFYASHGHAADRVVRMVHALEVGGLITKGKKKGWYMLPGTSNKQWLASFRKLKEYEQGLWNMALAREAGLFGPNGGVA